MLNNYPTAIDFVFKYEGGYVNNPKDPGGPTNRGITLKTAQAFWKHDATANDIKNMPKGVAENIYKTQYADKINFDTITSGLDLCALDAAVMSGPKRANAWLTKAKTIEEYQDLRLTFYKSLKIYPTFGKGWINRLNAGTLVANKLKNNLIVSPLQGTIKPAVTPTVIATTTGAVVTGGAIVASSPHHWLGYVIAGAIATVVAGYILIKYIQYRRAKVN